MKVIIVESPGKINKIESILGKDYRVLASYGHIIDLDPSKLSVDVDNSFEPTYIPYHDKKVVISKLKNGIKGADTVYIAADDDREGEMIGWSIARVLKLKNPIRITFNSITKKEIMDAIKNPKIIDANMVNAQKTRRILDRIVGYKLSPLLGKSLGLFKLSAGRVQSVVVRLCVDKENEISKFMSSELNSHYKVQGLVSSDSFKSNATLYSVTDNNKSKKGGFKGQPSKIENKEKVHEIITHCQKSSLNISHTNISDSIKNPSPPFTTSTLQQEANRKLGFSIKKTMMTAQKLYEAGFITYMRTDSINLSPEALDNIKEYVLDKHGSVYYQRRIHKSKSKNTQEAHEAIRPTIISRTSTSSNKQLGTDEARLYSLIWKRTVASQMASAKYDVTTVQISISELSQHFLMSTFQVLKFDGFLIVYNVKNVVEEDDNDDKDDDEDDTPTNNFKVPKLGSDVILTKLQCEENYPRPPPRFSEASLVDKLDPKNLNIGRPATYGPIIAKIIEREYVKIKDVDGKSVNVNNIIWVRDEDGTCTIQENSKIQILGGGKNKFVPTHLGILVTHYLTANFPSIMDYKFTADMENKLDKIALGELIWTDVLNQFYTKFNPLVMNLVTTNAYVKESRLLGIDPRNGNEVFATSAKHGYVFKSVPLEGKPVYAPIKEPLKYDTVTIHDALPLLLFPKELGKYKRKNVTLNKGQYGYYLKYDNIKISVDEGKMTLDEAVDKINEKEKDQLGVFKNNGIVYTILNGPHGPYVNCHSSKNRKGGNISLKGEDISDLTVEKLMEIINKKNKRRYTKKNE